MENFQSAELLEQVKQEIAEVKDEELRKVLQRVADDYTFRAKWAAALTLPIRKFIAETSIARQALMVDPLGETGEPRYDVDTEGIHLAFDSASHGSVHAVTARASEVWVPVFPITEGIEFLEALARRGQAGLVQRRIALLRDAFVRRENENFYSLLSAAVRTNGNLDPDYTVTWASGQPATVEFFSTLFNKLETKGREEGEYTVKMVLMNHRTLNDIRNWAATTNIDDMTRREIFVEGGRKTLWGAQLVPWNRIPDDEVYVLDTAKLGVMPIRTDFFTRDDPTAVREFKIRVLGYEEIGMAILDKNAVAMGKLQR